MKLLVVGCGSIGRRHALNAKSIAEVGVVDVDVSRADRLAHEANIASFSSLESGLALKPDAVIVATPHQSHVPVARLALDAGADVLIEKPISNDLAEAVDLVTHANLLGRQLNVACNMRFHPGPSKLAAALPKVGRPLKARAHFGSFLPDMRPSVDYRTSYVASGGAGAILLDCIHELDYLTWMFGDVDSVECRLSRSGELDVEADQAVLLLVHQSGVQSEISLDYLQRFKRRGCEIVGTHGTLLWESEGKIPEKCRVRSFTSSANTHEILVEDEVDPNQPYKRMLAQFLGPKSSGQNKLSDGTHACKCLEIALAALANAKTVVQLRQGAAIDPLSRL